MSQPLYCGLASFFLFAGAYLPPGTHFLALLGQRRYLEGTLHKVASSGEVVT